MTCETKPDGMLMTYSQLSSELRKRHIVDRSHRTIARWAKIGAEVDGVGLVRLKVQRIGSVRFSTVRWVREFLEAQR